MLAGLSQTARAPTPNKEEGQTLGGRLQADRQHLRPPYLGTPQNFRERRRPRPFRRGRPIAARRPSRFRPRTGGAGSERQLFLFATALSKMADLHRQLQEYLAQGKAGGPAAAEPLLAAEKEEEPGDGPAQEWLGRAGLRWTWARSPAESAAAGLACLPSVTRGQRLAAGGGCLLLAALCFGLAALYAPVLLLRARKFALLWSLGSALALAGGALLRGGAAFGRLLRCEEAPSRPAVLYMAALGATLFAALGLRSTLLTVLGAGAQVAALLAALVGLLPWGGGTALRLALGRLGRGAGLAKVLPV
nr:vesicle transport protein SFT2C [Pongo abelii]